ncbi:hypothetical protein [Microlunatus soli]|uniref:Glycosyl hydrolase family 65, N-terminal domain n=1 Tax=Microlunatus soli TaxID=630515 RepID=A0A1H1ZR31_9ACTN|nr:hypothetical protein [Microlunatus soli]SDT36188.1 hypothetical protein SAMN04489812_5395 [Microlunatus soli]
MTSVAIDRKAVVARHQVRRTAPDPLEPLTVGNGEFAFTMDVTGLQTLADLHDEVSARAEGRPAMGLHTQAQWGFHAMPNPDGWGLDDVMTPYLTPRGPVDYPDRYDFSKPAGELSGDERAGYYLWVNPHRIDLFRLGLELRDCPGDQPLPAAGLPDTLSEIDQVLDPWDGTVSSRFRHHGVDYQVRTVCHGSRDLVAISIDSAALADGRATLALSFPGASDTFADTADWDHPERHSTTLSPDPGNDRVREFLRQQDDTSYRVRLALSPTGRLEQLDDHSFRITADGSTLHLVLEALPGAEDTAGEQGSAARRLPELQQVIDSSRTCWEDFWRSGAALDLGACTDPRAAELERRIVLSQYLTRAQSAGSTPPAETGLTQNSWAGKFHLEMHWWHAAHFAIWGRPELLERSFRWYLDILPVAREIAARQGFSGVRWPKHVGPDGREAPNIIGPLLLWQQPHPIHFAELLRYAAAADDRQRILDNYGELVDQTAVFIGDYLYRDQDGVVHVPPATMPAQERYPPESVWDPPFELAYLRWGLQTAQHWRSLRGLPAEPAWDELIKDLAELPVHDDHYAAVGNPPRTEIGDHPSMVGALGLVPDQGIVDHDRMRRTLDYLDQQWDWPHTWGWDYPMIAMTATRIGEPERAVDALCREVPRNRYLANGHNCQHPSRLPLYLPGNGGLLAAVALMATGWIGGATGDHPGFPTDGWQVRSEGFPPRP